MKIITIVSPDKLSMTMFHDFYKSVYVGDDTLKILDLNCIFSKEAIDLKVKGFIESYGDYSHGIIKFKTKIKTVMNLSPELDKHSDYIIKFDIFSSHPDLIKDSDGEGKNIVERWNQNILKIDGGPRQ
jgi:hypothetical protein